MLIWPHVSDVYVKNEYTMMSLSRLTCSTQRFMKAHVYQGGDVCVRWSWYPKLLASWHWEHWDYQLSWLVKQSGEWVPLAAAFDQNGWTSLLRWCLSIFRYCWYSVTRFACRTLGGNWQLRCFAGKLAASKVWWSGYSKSSLAVHGSNNPMWLCGGLKQVFTTIWWGSCPVWMG